MRYPQTNQPPACVILAEYEDKTCHGCDGYFGFRRRRRVVYQPFCATPDGEERPPDSEGADAATRSGQTPNAPAASLSDHRIGQA